MRELVFVGLGLYDELGLSLRGLEEVKSAKKVFIEFYTSFMPNFSLQHLEYLTGKKPEKISREEIEEGEGETIIKTAEEGKVVFLVPGDPFIATTHIAIRLKAEKRGIKTRVIHAASIISAVISLSCLQNYKFGKSVTIPFIENYSETPYEVIAQNKKLGLHTLCLLDIQTEKKQYLSIKESLKFLLEIEKRKKEKIITSNTLVVGIARAGSKKPKIKANFLKKILKYDFGDPPYSLIFPGKLHFMEAKALIVLADAPKELRKQSL